VNRRESDLLINYQDWFILAISVGVIKFYIPEGFGNECDSGYHEFIFRASTRMHGLPKCLRISVMTDDTQFSWEHNKYYCVDF